MTHSHHTQWHNQKLRCRIVRFKPQQTPDIIPWLDNQHDRLQSLTMLIRLAQSVGGNHNWPDVVQGLAKKKIFSRMPGTKPVQKVDNSDSSIPRKHIHHIRTHDTMHSQLSTQDRNAVDHKKVSKSELSDITGGKSW